MKKLTSLVAIMIACFFMYVAANELITTIQLKQAISQSQLEIENLATQQELFEIEQKKLNDPEYVKQYARAKYLVSAEGEQIFKSIDKDDSTTDASNEK